MKIGILTFHRAENFGATLQAYALQTYLSGMGHEAKIVDYRCAAIERNYDILNPRILVSRKNVIASSRIYLDRFRNIRKRRTRKSRFNEFRKRYFNMTESVGRISRDMGFDAYITGSDQVWNLHLTHGVDDMYFLSFPMKQGARRIAYAASSENDPKGLMWENRGRISALLKEFSAISVREEFLKDDISRYIDKPVRVCVDPTFLLDSKSYDCLAKQPEVSERYILVYHMTPSPEGVRLADRMAQSRGCRVIEIFGGYSSSKDEDRHKCDLGPSEILGYISKAEAVITTSFHGLALSLIMNKDFWVMNHSGNHRQRNLLSVLNLTERLVDDHMDCDVDLKVDYQDANVRLAQVVESSKVFLKESLSEA